MLLLAMQFNCGGNSVGKAEIWNGLLFSQNRTEFILSFSGAFAVSIFIILSLAKALVHENTY
jgi:hypothetical protein